MRKYFKTAQLVPCYTDEGRCKWCRGQLSVCSLPLIRVYPNIWALAEDILEPARVKYGKPIRLLRGFLCRTKLKKMLEECETDEQWDDVWQYYKGEAVDICAYIGQPRKRKVSGSKWQVLGGQPEVTREENLKIAAIIEDMGNFDRLVVYAEHLHVSYKRNGENRHEVINYLTKE